MAHRPAHPACVLCPGCFARKLFVIARQFYVAFALDRVAGKLSLDADRALPVDVTGGLRDDQFLIFEFRLKR